MQVQLKVIKADGSREDYFHTKVLGTFSNALALVDQADISLAEGFAEVVTYFLYNSDHRRSVTSSEIFSIIKATLTATDREEAAVALSEHYHHRRMKRGRTEVVSLNIKKLADAHRLHGDDGHVHASPWDKSVIVADLVDEYELCRHTARTIASMVEEKIFSMQTTRVSVSLVKQLVLHDTAIVMRASQQLQTV